MEVGLLIADSSERTTTNRRSAMTRWGIGRAWLLAGALVLLFATTSWAEAVTEANVDAAVAAAKTPEDHAALAAYFTSKAEAAMTSAEKHDKMKKSFGSSKSMAQHCSNLASTDRQQAKEYTALARAQEQLSRGGGK
jgi:hypothetical protein